MADKCYEHTPETVTGNENETCTISWDMPVHTDKEIKSNRPDIIIKDQELKKCLLIDMAITAERNTFVKMTDKLSKYKNLEIEISTMWGLKTKTVPVVIEVLGLVKKGLGKYVEIIPRKHQYGGTPEDQPFWAQPIFYEKCCPPIKASRSQGNWLLLGPMDSTNCERRLKR